MNFHFSIRLLNYSPGFWAFWAAFFEREKKVEKKNLKLSISYSYLENKTEKPDYLIDQIDLNKTKKHFGYKNSKKK